MDTKRDKDILKDPKNKNFENREKFIVGGTGL